MTLNFDCKLTQKRELEKLQHERKQTWHGLGFRVGLFCIELQKDFFSEKFFCPAIPTAWENHFQKVYRERRECDLEKLVRCICQTQLFFFTKNTDLYI